MRVGRCALVSSLLLVLTFSVVAFAEGEDGSDQIKIPPSREVVFGQFYCYAYSGFLEENVLDFEGTVGIAAGRFEVQRFDGDSVDDCATIGNALANSAAELEVCTASPLRTGSSGATLHVMCHGDRNLVVDAIAVLSSEFLTVPLDGANSAISRQAPSRIEKISE